MHTMFWMIQKSSSTEHQDLRGTQRSVVQQPVRDDVMIGEVQVNEENDEESPRDCDTRFQRDRNGKNKMQLLHNDLLCMQGHEHGCHQHPMGF